jgi:hypothetical protein
MYKEKKLKCMSRYIGKCASRLFASLSAATKGKCRLRKCPKTITDFFDSAYRAVETLKEIPK